MADTTELITVWPDEAATAACAARLGALPALHDAVLALTGDLGAGKTSFVRHLLRAMGVHGRVRSPTYALAEPYEVAAPDGQARTTIWHFDFYRFADPREWEDAGLRDIFAQPGLKLCEWPERASGVMPPPDLALHIDVPTVPAEDDKATEDAPRRVTWRAHSPRGQQLLASVREQAAAPLTHATAPSRAVDAP